MEKQLKAVLFDLDGVVFDTEPQCTLFWGAQCREFHPEHPGLEYEIKGQTLVEIFDQWWSGELTQLRALVTQRLNDFEANMQFNYVPGFEQFVADLRLHGVYTAVVTSSNMPKMRSVYEHKPDFRNLFDAILTSEDFSESKPSPDCYLKAAARLGVSASQCVVVEDSLNGLKSGRSAGMFVVGLTTTNPEETISPLSDIQLPDFSTLSYSELVRLKSNHK